MKSTVSITDNPNRSVINIHSFKGPPTFEEATHIGEVIEDTGVNNEYNNFVNSDVPLLRLPPSPTAYRSS